VLKEQRAFNSPYVHLVSSYSHAQRHFPRQVSSDSLSKRNSAHASIYRLSVGGAPMTLHRLAGYHEQRKHSMLQITGLIVLTLVIQSLELPWIRGLCSLPHFPRS
jgi:hypothetical protein